MNTKEPVVAADNIDAGELFKDTRTDALLRLVYVDDQRVLGRTNQQLSRSTRQSYVYEFRDQFESNVDAGRYKLVDESTVPSGIDAPSMPQKTNGTEMQWADINGVGEKTALKLREEGIKTNLDVHRVEDNEITAVYGMSERKLEKMKEFIQDVE
jgi:predicted flap endonuclease-1-like 5' DNA nuclease